MDKLRAYQYFAQAARERSLSAAARRFDVSPAAVSKLVSSLERSLGERLFERSTRGLTLTAAGKELFESLEPALERIADIESSFGKSRKGESGTVTIAIQHLLAYHCLTPVLAEFHLRYPKIHLDLRDYVHGEDPQNDTADLRLAMVWNPAPELVMRPLMRTRMVVCAAPEYWSRHGMPQRPRDLEKHTCFVLRAVRDTIMDHWPFQRGQEKEGVVARGWITASNNNRHAIHAAVLAGEGVMRSLDLAIESDLRTGRLIPVLTDWELIDAPEVRVMYTAAAARLPRVRATLNFLGDLFRETEQRCAVLAGARPTVTAPPWAGVRPYGRASKAVGRL